MQVILDSSLARLGSAPIWGGKKGEFRDWTTSARATYATCRNIVEHNMLLAFSHRVAMCWVLLAQV